MDPPIQFRLRLPRWKQQAGPLDTDHGRSRDRSRGLQAVVRDLTETQRQVRKQNIVAAASRAEPWFPSRPAQVNSVVFLLASSISHENPKFLGEELWNATRSLRFAVNYHFFPLYWVVTGGTSGEEAGPAAQTKRLQNESVHGNTASCRTRNGPGHKPDGFFQALQVHLPHVRLRAFPAGPTGGTRRALRPDIELSPDIPSRP